MAEISVRAAVVTDAGAMARVHRLSRAQYYGVPPTDADDREEMWAHFIGDPDRTTYVACDADEVIAFVSAHRSGTSGDDLELIALYVLPTHVGRGIGSALHNRFLGLVEAGSSALLEVWAGNHGAIGFYRRRGWVPTSRTRPGPQELDFVTYRLSRVHP
jgi:GNAT superfamily N-acetyltransferase